MKKKFDGQQLTFGKLALIYGITGICSGLAYAVTFCIAGAIEDAYGYDIQDWMERHNPFIR